MTERPILFSAPMVRSILDGRKTQTRRVVKPVPTFNAGGAILDADGGQEDYVEPHWVLPSACSCPYGQPGDLLWVRETWAPRTLEAWPNLDRHMRPIYRASEDRPEWKRIWKPSIHMPRWASRITLRITDIRVERLQDISEADAGAEGAPDYSSLSEASGEDMAEAQTRLCWRQRWFASLWNKINGPGAWDANPWVWVVSFEKVKP